MKGNARHTQESHERLTGPTGGEIDTPWRLRTNLDGVGPVDPAGDTRHAATLAAAITANREVELDREMTDAVIAWERANGY